MTGIGRKIYHIITAIKSFAHDTTLYRKEIDTLRSEFERNRFYMDMGKNFSGVVHTLRSRLMSVAGFNDLLSKLLTEKDPQELIELQKIAIEEMVLHLDNLLYVVRSCQDETQRIIACNPVIKTIVTLKKYTHRGVNKNNILLELDAEDAIFAAPLFLRQIISNFLDNACEAAQRAADNTVRIHTRIDNSCYKLSIQDYGPGIKECFDCRYKTCMECTVFKLGKTSKATGSGIGIPYSKVLLKKIGADLSIISSPKGTTIILLFPISAPNALDRQNTLTSIHSD